MAQAQSAVTELTRELAVMLKRQADHLSALRLAATLWTQAAESAAYTERQHNALAEATSIALKTHFCLHDDVDDLFSDDAEEDICAAAFLQLCGLKTVPVPAAIGKASVGSAASLSQSPPSFGLRISPENPEVSLAFLKTVLEACPEMATAAATRALDPFRSYRLDKLENETADDSVLRELRVNRSVHLLFSVALAHEAERSLEISHSSAGAFERGSALSPLISATTIIASTALFGFVARSGRQPLPGAPPFALNFFAQLPGFPQPQPQPILAHIDLLRLRLHVLQDVATVVLEKALKSPAHREGALAWISRAIILIQSSLADAGQFKVRGEMHDEVSDSETASSGFVLNLATLVLRLFDPLCKNAGISLPAVDWSYVMHDSRLHFSAEAPITEGGGESGSGTCGGKKGSSSGESGSSSSHNTFKFTTEIFFLATSAMHLVQKMQSRKEDHFQTSTRTVHHFEGALGGGGQDHPEVQRLRGCLVTFELGWHTHLLDPQFMALAVRWAQYTANWLCLHAKQPGARYRFQHLPAKMIKAVAAVWVQSGRHFGKGSLADLNVFTPGMAQEAVLFCNTFMSNGLVTSPVLQDCLLSVLDMIINYGGGSSDTTARNNVYFGAHRGLAGIVMNSSAIRKSTAPALMQLYSNCQHAEGINSDDDSAFNKHGIRHKVARIVEKLYRHPLPESKASILEFLAGDGYDLFLVSAIDTVAYMFQFGIKALEEGLILEQERGARATPEYVKLKDESRIGFQNSNVTFDMLAMLFENRDVQERFARCIRETQLRVVEALWTFIEWLFIDCRVLEGGTRRLTDPEEWMGGESFTVAFRRPCLLLAVCLSSNTKLLRVLESAPTFDLRLFEGAAGCQGGENLQCFVAVLKSSSASSATDGDIPWEQWLQESAGTKEREGETAAVEHGSGEGTMEYTEAMLEVGQVASTNGFPSGHYFESKKLGGAGGRGGGALAKILMKEFKKMNKLLPSPHTDGGTIAVIFDEDNFQFARAVVTGRSGTPYFGGAFVFDVYFPDQYPQIPPLLQNKTTGNGTWRAHNNLYGDGKVCLSLLQNFSSNSSEKWDPDHSSLYQVLMGIQSQILCEEPYYAAGRGKTPATALRSRAENHDIRVKTMHHAMVAMVRERRRFGPEVAEVIYAHFVALEWRLVVDLRRCLAEAEAEQSPRSTAMMHRVIVETRTWFRKLRAGHAGEGQQQELNSDDRSAEDEFNLVAEARGAALSDTHISDDLRDWKKRSETHKAEPAAQETSLNGSQRSAALGEAAREAREAGPSKHVTSSGMLAPAGAADKDGNAPHLKRRAAAHKLAQKLAVDESERKSALEAAACDARAERAAKYQRLEQRGGRDGSGGSYWWLATLALVAVAAAAIAIAVPALQ